MRIDFFLINKKIYTRERYVISNLGSALQHLGVNVKIFTIEDGNILSYLHTLDDDPPDWTFSLGDLFVQKQPLCALTKIPHFYWENLSLSYSFHQLSSPFSHVGFVDRAVELKNLTFLPHGYQSSFSYDPSKQRDFEVVMFDALVDTDDLEKGWKEIMDEKGERVLRKIIATSVHDNVSPLEVITKSSLDMGPANFYLFLAEEYLSAQRVRHLIESIEGKKIHLFGDHVGNNWLKRLKNASNVYLHSPLPYTEHFEVLKRAQLLVRDQLITSSGSDEWAFSALALGCAVTTSGSNYLKNSLSSLPFYKRDDLNQVIDKLLKTREEQIKNHKNDLNDHTFEKRAQTLLDYMQR